ncbi:transcription elongation GreA/GreB family factor [Methylovorus glucosotrophus]|uniref:GreA/GreB family elongation factor n=1 Tax=Methylovorus glucosotrophus TaxID=266009 RepID=UPI0013311F4B|nr:GreA/GreB family elongation factor [Methylovorus glucosotrophus]KAF0844126.1 transcription elongation GreA/GreB family factor [Methylovorus glucosotrophus]
MSRGFVKEDDLEHAGTDLPERPLSPHPNYVTPTGLKQLKQHADQLDKERLPLVPRKEDPIAEQQLAMIDRDLRYLHARLESAILVDPAKQPTETVLFGATVEVEDEVGETHVFMIVGEDEADIASNRVSWVSPLANALIGQKVGDSVTWHRPAGNLELEIIAIHY